MNKRKIAVGPGASSLILIAVVLALSVLTVLTMISARSDEALSQRSTESRQETYQLFAEGERSLARLDGILAETAGKAAGMEAYLAAVREKLPENMRMEADQVFWTEEAGNRALECGVRILPPDGAARMEWTVHRLGAKDIWEEDDFGDEEEDAFDDSAEEDEDSDEDEAFDEDEDADEEDEWEDEEDQID